MDCIWERVWGRLRKINEDLEEMERDSSKSSRTDFFNQEILCISRFFKGLALATSEERKHFSSVWIVKKIQFILLPRYCLNQGKCCTSSDKVYIYMDSIWRHQLSSELWARDVDWDEVPKETNQLKVSSNHFLLTVFLVIELPWLKENLLITYIKL